MSGWRGNRCRAPARVSSSVHQAVGVNQLPRSLDAALQWDALAQPLTMATGDLREGIRAIRERRAPSFKRR